MQQDQTPQDHFEADPTNSGGAAPADRRCQYLKADGKGCRDWAIRGEDFCYRHGVFLRYGRGIDVPLLEDESSIVLVLSETLRAVAHGLIPVIQARLMMDGCRLAYAMQMEKLKVAGIERVSRRRDALEQESAEQQEQPATLIGRSEPQSPNREPGSPEQETAGSEAETTENETPRKTHPNPVSTMDSRHRWNKEEEPLGVLAAQAEPLAETRTPESRTPHVPAVKDKGSTTPTQN